MPTVAQTAFAALDFESTGASSQSGDHPVQVGVAILEDWTPQWELGFMSRIAAEATAGQETWSRHGMEAPAPAEAPRLVELWPQLKARLAGRWLLAHGAATERRFLRAFPFHGFGPWVDTLKLARAFDPLQPSHTLSDLARAYGLEPALQTAIPGFRWHDALCDAWACLLLFRHIIESRGLQGEDVSSLLRLDDSPYHKWKSRPR